MYKHLHFLIVPTSEHLNFTVNNGFAFGGEHQVLHPTGGGRHSRSHCKLGCRDLACRQPHGSGEELSKKGVSRWGEGQSASLCSLHVPCNAHCNAVRTTGMVYPTDLHRVTAGRIAVP